MTTTTDTAVLPPFPFHSNVTIKPPLDLAQNALAANKRIQEILMQRAEQLEAELEEADRLLAAASTDDGLDDPESEVVIPGAKKATGLFPPSEFLNPTSPFYEEAMRRSNYMTNTNVHPLKGKDFEVLADAVRRENERLQAYRSRAQGSAFALAIDLDNNVEGLDWTKIAERVSDASQVKRSAADCRVCWIGDRHSRINHAEWSASETEKLASIVSEYTKRKEKVNWVYIAQKLRTNRTPIDCMRQGIPRQRHNWTPDADQKLIEAVKLCVARNVSEHAMPSQCQNRWYKTLDPALKRGNWTEEEDDRLRKAVAGYGTSWMQVASAIPGRTNDQCRERWQEQVNRSAKEVIWTEDEDKILLESVAALGNQWKLISFKIGNKTGQNCRMRFDKLKRIEKARTGGTPGPSRSKLAQASGGSSTPTTSQVDGVPQSADIALPVVAPKPRPRPKPVGNGKGKAKEVYPEAAQNPQDASDNSVIASAAPHELMPTTDTSKPAPAKRGKKKAPATDTAAALITTSVSVNVTSQPRPKPRPRAKNKVQAKEVDAGSSLAPNSSVAAESPHASELRLPEVPHDIDEEGGRKRKAKDSVVQAVGESAPKKRKTQHSNVVSISDGVDASAGPSPNTAASETSMPIDTSGFSDACESMDVDNEVDTESTSQRRSPRKRTAARNKDVGSEAQVNSISSAPAKRPRGRPSKTA
ncbi:hypothetical protein B0H34DRAFT_793436 [Crassisporium funariophilum]|nr:hypothetical protein B0H34DRAFT_793436 [Crassisporium funariophilum]